jgi:flagellar biosynthesis protein FlhA
MFENTRQEYSVKTCSNEEPEILEDLLNQMSSDGWEVYMIHETESKRGGLQYSCIFSREIEDKEDLSERIVDVDNFTSRMEKMFQPSDEPYQRCKEIQTKINLLQKEIAKIKKSLDLTSKGVNRNALNEEISQYLKELAKLKDEFSDIVDPVHMIERINQDKLTITISAELIDLVDTTKNGDLISETVNLRQKLTDRLGYVIPAIHFTDSDELEANEYRIDVRGVKVLTGFVYLDYRRFRVGQSNFDKKPKDALGDIDPITGQVVFWIEESKTKDYWEKGFSSVEVVTHGLEYVVCRYVDELLDYSDVNSYIGIVGSQNLYLIDNLIPDHLSVGDLRYIFAGLIREKISIKDITYVFERLNDFVQETDDKDILLEKLRISLKRQICSSISDSSSNIYGISLSDKLNDDLETILDYESLLTSRNPIIRKLVKSTGKLIKDSGYNVSNIAIVATPDLRRDLFFLFEQFIPGLSVITKDEIYPEFNIEMIGTL